MSGISQDDLERMNTRLSAEWIEKMTRNNPARILASGNIRMPPCRMSYAQAALPADDKLDSTTGKIIKGKYGSALLWAPMADLDAARTARLEMLKTCFPKNPTGKGMDDPIKDQGEKVAPDEGGSNKLGKTTQGYVPGWSYISANANLDYPPGLNEIVNGVPTACTGPRDELQLKFYSGCWVIPTLTVFHGKAKENPNIFYGLAGVLKIADDNSWKGGSGDGPSAFEGIQIEENLDATALFE